MHATYFFLDYSENTLTIGKQKSSESCTLRKYHNKNCASGRIAYKLAYLQGNTAKNRKFWKSLEVGGVCDKE